jgi:hypothetical protein
VQDVRTRRVQHVPQLALIRSEEYFLKPPFPVVHELDNRQPVVPAPRACHARGWIISAARTNTVASRLNCFASSKA